MLDLVGRGLVETPHRANLNPGTADFEFGVRMRLTRGLTDSNIMQKGFYTGSQYKLSLHPNGGQPQISCRISGSRGAVHVFTTSNAVVDGGGWHDVRCRREGDTVDIIIDGELLGSQTGPIGDVGNQQDYWIGGKGLSQQSDPDQYLGLLDDAFVTVGAGEGGTTLPPLPVGDATATVETDPVLSSGDAADDPAVWVHPTDPARSVVIGNDKGGALEVYDLDGTRIQRITEGFFGNVDVRSNVLLGGKRIDVVAVWRAGLRLYTIDPDTRQLTNLTEGGGSIAVPSGGEGLCLYRSPDESTYAYVISRAGTVAQYRLEDGDSDGLIGASRVRLWEMGSEAEGCVADDERQLLYISEEDVGLWRYGAEPSDGTGASSRTSVDTTTANGGRLLADIEGLALVEGPDGGGYLIASAQAGSDTINYYAVYERGGDNEYVRSFQVVDGALTDRCGRTDGIEATSTSLGPSFPFGLFVCQDNTNTEPGGSGNQNFKLVPLERVVPVGQPDPGDPPPSAVIDPVICSDLSCTFSAHSSSDNGTIETYSWDFGDGSSATGVEATHTYQATGTYGVTLTVTDDQGGTSVASRSVSVDDAAPAQLAFRGGAEASGNTTQASLQLPTGIQSGDGMLLFVSANRADIAINEPSGAADWTPLDTVIDQSMQTGVWTAVASGDDADSTVTVTTSGRAKLHAQVLVYSGTELNNPIAAFESTNETVRRTDHTAPTLDAAPPGSWVVSYWADKTADSTGWADPSGLTQRAEYAGSGGGRIGVLAADSNGPVASSPVGGETARSTSANDKATMWTLVLDPSSSTGEPPTAPEPPTASLVAPTCSDLVCEFDASGSTPTESIVSFEWDFGDGSTSTGGLRETHMYPAPGTYTVSVTVSDADGLTDTATATATALGVEPPDPGETPTAFREATRASANWTVLGVDVPPTAEDGDVLLLFVTGNRSDVSITLDAAGWQLLGQAEDQSMQTLVWATTVSPSDVGASVAVEATAVTKLDAQMLAYSGVDRVSPVSAVSSSIETGTSATHVTPVVDTSAGGWVVSYWADKSSSSSGWTIDPALTERGQSVGSGGGRITSASADTNGPAGPGQVGGFSASASSTNKATTWTIELSPATE